MERISSELNPLSCYCPTIRFVPFPSNWRRLNYPNDCDFSRLLLVECGTHCDAITVFVSVYESFNDNSHNATMNAKLWFHRNSRV